MCHQFYLIHSRAFTLIELITVITLIIVLVGMALPVYQRAREAGRKTTCASNLKQIGTSLSMYLDDYRHALPAIYQGGSYIGWAVTLNSEYIDDTKLFYCPSAPST